MVVTAATLVLAASVYGVLHSARSHGPTPNPGPVRGVELIAFSSDRDGGGGIYVMDPDGSRARNLGGAEAGAFSPVWSLGGTRIAFVAWRDGGRSEIFVMRSDGTGVRRLTRDRGYDLQPTWSPDGRRIAFVRESGADSAIYVMDAGGANQRRLPHSEEGWAPAWSPDGTRIAFASARTQSTRGASMSRIFVMDTDGSGLTRLALGVAPAWSPDGTRIAFERRGDVWVMRADGTGRTRLTRTPNTRDVPADPTWSPDGKRIAFTSDRDGDAEVFVMNADGSDLEQLTHVPGEDSVQAWSVVPASIVASLPSPAPEEPIPPEELVGSTCYLSKISGDFDGDGSMDTAVIYTPGRGGLNCAMDVHPRVAVFLASGKRIDQVFDTCDGPICSAIGAPDFNEDGHSELAIEVSWGVTFDEFGLYRVTSHGLVPLELAAPGDPAGRLRPGPVQFQTASSLSYWGTLNCGTGSNGRPRFVQRFAERAGPVGTQVWKIHETVLTIQGDVFRVTSSGDLRLPLDSPEAKALRSGGRASADCF